MAGFGLGVGRVFGAAGAYALAGVQATGVHSTQFARDVVTGAKLGYVDKRAELDERFALSRRAAELRKAAAPRPEDTVIDVEATVVPPKARARKQATA